jgi:hypothetical protein
MIRISTEISSIIPLQIRPFGSYQFRINWKEILFNIYIEISAGLGMNLVIKIKQN